jgi:phospholipid-transporting ATPase
MVNVQIVFLFILLLLLSVGSSVGAFIRTVRIFLLNWSFFPSVLNVFCLQFTFENQMWYLFLQEGDGKAKTFIEDILTFIILYNNLIPIRSVPKETSRLANVLIRSLFAV